MMKKISPYPARLRHARHYIQVAESADNQYLSGGAGVVRGLALFDREYANLGPDELRGKLVAGGAFVDVKAAFDAKALEAAGYRVWRL